ncbi:MAG: hypothetical protein KDA90_11730 [Planctomycetaceae bacterium]|nr:hypothetical protein [Planctomycetaceae bacterium]
MTDSNQMSRRDWFRLRLRSTESSDTANRENHSMGGESHVLQPVDQPVNHDGMDLSTLPPMSEACLSEEQVRQLFFDIETLATDILLMQRSPRSTQTVASKATSEEQLRTARDTLLSGSIPRVQIRYHWKNANWIDTLERRNDGVRLIRIAHGETKAATREPRGES